MADDYRAGKELVDTHNFKPHEKYFQTILEIGRRHKVMNPEKMRGEYGKLVYLLQVIWCESQAVRGGRKSISNPGPGC